MRARVRGRTLSRWKEYSPLVHGNSLLPNALGWIVTGKGPTSVGPFSCYNVVMSKHVHRMLSKDIESETGVCANCGPVAIVFLKSKNGWRCSVGRKLQKRMGTPGTYTPGVGYMSGKERAQRIASQSGKCAICGMEAESMHRDHDHDTNRDRGFLCRHCNIGLGHFKDSPELLEAAAVYLRWHNKQAAAIRVDADIAI